jgi:hypothetical protein
VANFCRRFAAWKGDRARLRACVKQKFSLFIAFIAGNYKNKIERLFCLFFLQKSLPSFPTPALCRPVWWYFYAT